MGIKRIVDTSFWTDGKVDEFSPEDKYFMLYLLTNPFSSQLGIYEISIKQVAFQLGYSMDAVKVLLDRFETKYGMILYSQETNEIAIKNFLAHSVVKGGAPVRDCLIKEMRLVKAKHLIADVFSHLQSKPTFEQLNTTVKEIVFDFFKNGTDLPFCNTKRNDSSTNRGTIRGRIADNENENDNDNENDNGASLHDADGEPRNDSPKDKPKNKKPVKHKHGEFQNVLLTDAEFEKLGADYGIPLRDQAISFFDAYIEEKGYKSKSHNLAIRRWVIDAVNSRGSQNPQPINRTSYQNPSKADELDEFYRMAGDWANQ